MTIETWLKENAINGHVVPLYDTCTWLDQQMINNALHRNWIEFQEADKDVIYYTLTPEGSRALGIPATEGDKLGTFEGVYHGYEIRHFDTRYYVYKGDELKCTKSDVYGAKDWIDGQPENFTPQTSTRAPDADTVTRIPAKHPFYAPVDNDGKIPLALDKDTATGYFVRKVQKGSKEHYAVVRKADNYQVDLFNDWRDADIAADTLTDETRELRAQLAAVQAENTRLAERVEGYQNLFAEAGQAVIELVDALDNVPDELQEKIKLLKFLLKD